MTAFPTSTASPETIDAQPQRGLIVVGVALLAALVWSYWSTWTGLAASWQEDANYSVGQLVPFAALYLLWNDRALLRECRIEPCWWGLGVLVVAQLVRAFGVLMLYRSAERYSLLLTIVGVVLLVGGTRITRRVGWVLAFLILMIPLPGRVHDGISGPLQSLASSGAVFLLELLGVPAVQEGHVIVLRGTTPLAVAEACSGLRMLTAFVVVGSVLAYIAQRPLTQKALLVISTVPVAIVCNLIRLLITACLFLTTDSATAERFFHDFAGWTMMPLAIVLMMLELSVLKRLSGPTLETATSKVR